jgi:hypothetical protein
MFFYAPYQKKPICFLYKNMLSCIQEIQHSVEVCLFERSRVRARCTATPFRLYSRIFTAADTGHQHELMISVPAQSGASDAAEPMVCRSRSEIS